MNTIYSQIMVFFQAYTFLKKLLPIPASQCGVSGSQGLTQFRSLGLLLDLWRNSLQLIFHALSFLHDKQKKKKPNKFKLKQDSYIM